MQWWCTLGAEIPVDTEGREMAEAATTDLFEAVKSKQPRFHHDIA
jgi:hypothetical protein